MTELKKRTEEILHMIDIYVIDNHNESYIEKVKALKEIMNFCQGPK